MAKLTETQLKRRAKQEKIKQETIRKKREIQKKKELWGENWKAIEHRRMKDEIELEIGGEYLPKLEDSKDLYDYFSPIAFYKDKEYKNLKMDYSEFAQSQQLYKEALDEVDDRIAKINEALKEDGADSYDTDAPANDEQMLKWEAFQKENEKEVPDLKPKKGQKIKAESPEELPSEHARLKRFVHRTLSAYFNRFVPLYNKHICTCCGKSLELNNYYQTMNLTCANRIDSDGTLYMWVCKECANKLFAYFYTVATDKDLELAFQKTCCYLNIYWDIDCLYKARKKYEDVGRSGTLLGSYMKVIASIAPGKTFMDSPFLDEKYEAIVRIPEDDPNSAPIDWSKEDAKNKSTVIKMVGYDPFSYETDENKKILYKDLLNILDEGMQNDLVKFQAGIQIVLSFFKLRQLNEKEYKLTQENAPVSELKALSDLKAKELTAITNFSRDNGFSERYATAKAKGENTLTGIMNKMNEQKYEKALLNRYDIETSATIQQAADASFKAIFGQLGLSDSEVWKLTQDQFEELTKLRRENTKLQEEVRKAKYRVAELNLLEKEREAKGRLDDEEVY
jgi:hypothetical protein